MNERIARWLDVLLHMHDTPERTALAFALGVFFGFSPLLGLHTVLGLLVAFLFGLNRVAVLIGVYSNTPWFIAPYYALTTWMGAWLLRSGLTAAFEEQIAALFRHSVFTLVFWESLLQLTRAWFWPFVVGSTLGALILSVVAYRLALAVIVAHRRRTIDSSRRAAS